VERDAIALTWLLRPALRRIEVDAEGASHRLESQARRSHYSQFLHYDATTDLAVPTVYTVQLHSGSSNCAQVVSCSTHSQFAAACRKTVRECLNTRLTLETSVEIPQEVDEFCDLLHGAVYMGRKENRGAFGFLLSSQESVRLEQIERLSCESAEQRVGELLQRLRQRQMHLYLVDLTTEDVREAGLHVVRAIIPELMPFSYIQRARYLGHPRLNAYARTIGREGAEINPWPQPFA
jgi:ribosomal protein S12 methylthiotransferase accessory factor